MSLLTLKGWKKKGERNWIVQCENKYKKEEMNEMETI